jgi:hypothetical protein
VCGDRLGGYSVLVFRVLGRLHWCFWLRSTCGPAGDSAPGRLKRMGRQAHRHGCDHARDSRLPVVDGSPLTMPPPRRRRLDHFRAIRRSAQSTAAIVARPARMAGVASTAPRGVTPFTRRGVWAAGPEAIEVQWDWFPPNLCVSD